MYRSSNCLKVPRDQVILTVQAHERARAFQWMLSSTRCDKFAKLLLSFVQLARTISGWQRMQASLDHLRLEFRNVLANSPRMRRSLSSCILAF